MPRFRRIVVPNYPHHVTQRGVRRQQTFFEKSDYALYLKIAERLLDSYSVGFLAYCLMPNHIHAVVVPADQTSMSRYFAKLHRTYARETNLKHDWKGHLWQERFYSVPMEEAHALQAMRYVELNPVRSGLARKPEDWRWSSARANLRLQNDPLVDPNTTSSMVADWCGYLNEVIPDTETDNLRRQTRVGRPEGTEAFIDSIERATGRVVRRRRTKKVTGPFSRQKR